MVTEAMGSTHPRVPQLTDNKTQQISAEAVKSRWRSWSESPSAQGCLLAERTMIGGS